MKTEISVDKIRDCAYFFLPIFSGDLSKPIFIIETYCSNKGGMKYGN